MQHYLQKRVHHLAGRLHESWSASMERKLEVRFLLLMLLGDSVWPSEHFEAPDMWRDWSKHQAFRIMTRLFECWRRCRMQIYNLQEPAPEWHCWSTTHSSTLWHFKHHHNSQAGWTYKNISNHHLVYSNQPLDFRIRKKRFFVREVYTKPGFPFYIYIIYININI